MEKVEKMAKWAWHLPVDYRNKIPIKILLLGKNPIRHLKVRNFLCLIP